MAQPDCRTLQVRRPSRSKTKLQLATILLLAAAPEPVKIEPSEFSLKPAPASSRVTPEDCRRDVAAGEIVVCGRDADAYRYREIKPPPGIEVGEGGVIGFDLGGARLEPLLSEVTLPDGRVSKRIMMTLKVPF